MEATAQWAQHEVFQNDTTYTAYIPAQLNESWIHMDTRPIEGGTGIPYSPLFPFYLIEKLDPARPDKSIIRNTWERYWVGGSCGQMKRVIDTLLPQDNKITDIFPKYAEANYFLAYPPPPDIRADLQANDPAIPPDFRPARDIIRFNDQFLASGGPNNPPYRGVYIQPLGVAYAEFTQVFTQPNLGRSLQINVQIPVANSTTAPIVKIWTIYKNLPTLPPSILVPLDNISGTWQGSITVQNFDSDQILRVVMMVVNGQTSGSSITWTYQGNIR